MTKFTEEHKDKISQAHLARKADLMNEICELAKEGMPTKEIALKFNKTPQNINKILRRRGVESVRGVSPKKGISSNPEKIENICKMAKEGKTAQEIADYNNESQGLKHSAGHIYKILETQDIEIPRKASHNANPERIREIIEMFKEGMRPTDIAKHFNYKGCARVVTVLTQNGYRSKRANKKRPDGYYENAGYLYTRVKDDDPMVSMRAKSGLILVHRLNMARHLNRPLNANETVHHIDGNKENNLIENLQLRIGQHGSGQAFICRDCKSKNIDTKDIFTCINCNSTKISFGEI